ncbi:hypothetical protein ACOSQ2_000435 [Xanthoceras sorbifolium]
MDCIRISSVHDQPLRHRYYSVVNTIPQVLVDPLQSPPLRRSLSDLRASRTMGGIESRIKDCIREEIEKVKEIVCEKEVPEKEAGGTALINGGSRMGSDRYKRCILGILFLLMET